MKEPIASQVETLILFMRILPANPGDHSTNSNDENVSTNIENTSNVLKANLEVMYVHVIKIRICSWNVNQLVSGLCFLL